VPSVKDGKVLIVKANKLTDKNIYIQSVKLNGKPVNTSILTNAELNQSGELVFEMCGKPNKKWGVK